MDLVTYLENNGVKVPRMHNVELCKELTPYNDGEVLLNLYMFESNVLSDLLASGWTNNFFCYGRRFKKAVKKYAKKYVYSSDGNDYHFLAPIWDNIHGKHRKILKFEFKKMNKQFNKYREAWDRYAGRSDVIVVRARIGGSNWISYDGKFTIASKPIFLEKVDDPYDNTFCNIYFKFSEV